MRGAGRLARVGGGGALGQLDDLAALAGPLAGGREVEERDAHRDWYTAAPTALHTHAIAAARALPYSARRDADPDRARHRRDPRALAGLFSQAREHRRGDAMH